MGEFNRSEAWTDDRRVLQHVGNHCKAAHQSSLAMNAGRSIAYNSRAAGRASAADISAVPAYAPDDALRTASAE